MDSLDILGIAIILAYIVIFGGVSMFLGRNKGKSIVLTFMLGIWLGPIGWAICYFMKPPLSSRGSSVDSKKIEANFKKHPIPFMRRYGWTFFLTYLVGLFLYFLFYWKPD